MKTLDAVARAVAAATLLGALAAVAASHSEYNVFKTNRMERWITNVIEVSVPENRFANVYRTNWVARYRTNVVDTYWTNVITRTMTNEVIRTRWVTNWVDAYRTNLKTITLTNWETVVATTFQTNQKVLTLTNWETVVVMKTNYVTSYFTNVVDLDVPVRVAVAPAGAPVAKASAAPVCSERSAPPGEVSAIDRQPAVPSTEFTLHASRSGSTRDNSIEVVLRLSGLRSQPERVLQWRVESADGALLCFGQDREFKRFLPPGRYQVEARASKTGSDTLLISRGTLAVTGKDVWIQAKPLASR